MAERDTIYRGRFEELKREFMIGVEELRRQEGINGEEVFSELEEDLQQIEAKVFPMSHK